MVNKMLKEGFKFYTNVSYAAASSLLIPAIIKYKIAEKLLEGPKSIPELVANSSLNPERLHRCFALPL